MKLKLENSSNIQLNPASESMKNEAKSTDTFFPCYNIHKSANIKSKIHVRKLLFRKNGQK